MSVAPILPIPGVPDDLLRAINDRFRELSGSSVSSTATGSAAGLFFTHANRPDANGTPAGTFGTETDRTVVYQVETVSSAQVWRYVSGTMTAVFASRPADLGVNDAAFPFLASDTYQLYRWSGTAWVEVTPANLEQIAYASGSLTLPTGSGSAADVPGATITLTRAGRHLIVGVFYFVEQGGTTDKNFNLFGTLVANGATQAGVATVLSVVNGLQATISQQWAYTAGAAGQVVKLQGYKTAGAGSSLIGLTHTSISALWVGP